MLGHGRIRFGYVVAVFFLVIAIATTDVLSLALAAGLAVATMGAEWYVARRAHVPEPEDDLDGVTVAWARGRALARRFRMSEVPGGARVDVGQGGLSTAYVITDAADVLEASIGTVRSTPGGRLEVVTKDADAIKVWLADGGLVVSEEAEALMYAGLGAHPERDLPGGYKVEVSHAGGAIYATVTDEAGTKAAEGRISVFSGDAVADRLSVETDHRRRGLGSAVLARLVAEARDAGAVRGLAGVPAEGEALFEALGWATLARIVVADAPRSGSVA